MERPMETVGPVMVVGTPMASSSRSLTVMVILTGSPMVIWAGSPMV